MAHISSYSCLWMNEPPSPAVRSGTGTRDLPGPWGCLVQAQNMVLVHTTTDGVAIRCCQWHHLDTRTSILSSVRAIRSAVDLQYLVQFKSIEKLSTLLGGKRVQRWTSTTNFWQRSWKFENVLSVSCCLGVNIRRQAFQESLKQRVLSWRGRQRSIWIWPSQGDSKAYLSSVGPSSERNK